MHKEGRDRQTGRQRMNDGLMRLDGVQRKSHGMEREVGDGRQPEGEVRAGHEVHCTLNWGVWIFF